MNDKISEETLGKLAKSLSAACVRNTFLEDLHAGDSPLTKTGDFTDVKVVFPNGEIPWNEVSRINNKEMKVFIKEVVDKLFTYFVNMNDKDVNSGMHLIGDMYTNKWDKPQIDEEFLDGLKIKL